MKSGVIILSCFIKGEALVELSRRIKTPCSFIKSYHEKPKIHSISSCLLKSSVSEEETTAIKVNPLVASIKISKTVEVFSRVKEMEAKGVDVTSLCVGEPDFPPPSSVLEAALSAIRDKETRYTAVSGIITLRKAIAEDLRKRKGLNYDANTEILVGNGAKQNVYQGMLATCGVGDVVLVPAPYWPSYPEMASLVGAKTIIIPTQARNSYLLTPTDLRAALEANPSSKMLILCNPSNPTGSVYSQKVLQELAVVLRDFPQVVIIADEIYERLIYDDAQHISFATLPDMFHRTITINGFSKAFAMTGMRLGYSAAPKGITKACTTIQSQLTSCAGSVSQIAGIAALTKVTDQEMKENVQIMQMKRDFVLAQLKSMDRVEIDFVPQGAFYVLPNLAKFYQGDDTQLCLDLLEKKQLALVPGSSFGAPGTVRISYATSMEELEIAMNKLREFLSTLN